MVSIIGRIPVKRIDQSARCPECQTGGPNVDSREGVKAIRHGGGDNRISFECDSCDWSSRVYEYDGENPTPLSHLYGNAQIVTFCGATGGVQVNGTPLQDEPDYRVRG